jgi:hypothetical protein
VGSIVFYGVWLEFLDGRKQGLRVRGSVDRGEKYAGFCGGFLIFGVMGRDGFWWLGGRLKNVKKGGWYLVVRGAGIRKYCK